MVAKQPKVSVSEVGGSQGGENGHIPTRLQARGPKGRGRGQLKDTEKTAKGPRPAGPREGTAKRQLRDSEKPCPQPAVRAKSTA